MLVEAIDSVNFEFVIGIVAPIGTNVSRVTSVIASELRQFEYSSEVIRLSSLLDEYPQADGLPQDPGDADYYTRRMDAGDKLRRDFCSGDALAAYAISTIRARRIETRGSVDQSSRHAWILRTIKHPDEVALLRATYGKRFVLVSVDSPEEDRRESLMSTMRDAAPSRAGLGAAVAELLDRDERDASDEYGQHVRDAYSLADYFLDLRTPQVIDDGVRRMLGLLFGEPFITPTRDEICMFLAFASSMRSADPGRQVGALISNSHGEMLALGTNEVPRFGGGEYWGEDPDDNRDFRRGYDFNKRMTRRVLREFVEALSADGFLNQNVSSVPSDQRLDWILANDLGGIRSSRVMSLIEFGRIAHAEMSAISYSARNGVSIRGGTLYTTAYPCHMCMRLIIDAGIDRIVYVDPYPKSLAAEMYDTEIRHGAPGYDSRVAVEPFRGASWRVYSEVFRGANRDRDTGGSFCPWDRRGARMRLAEVDPLVNADVLEGQVPVALDAVLQRLSPAVSDSSGTVKQRSRVLRVLERHVNRLREMKS